MRAEDKELEGPDLGREERTREETELEGEELPALGGEELRDAELAHRSTLFDALRLVLDRQNVTVSLLYLPQRETHALEALQAAVNGHDSVGEFVFAEDRRALLEQALAVLQENVTHGDPEQLAELHGKFAEVTEQVAELRDRLTNLEDAQDEIQDEKRRLEEEAAQDDGDDEPAEPHDLRLDGPERPEPPAAPSTLDGPERPAPPAPPSTLYGDAPAEEAKPPSELAAEAAAAEAAKPWWSRPFG